MSSIAHRIVGCNSNDENFGLEKEDTENKTFVERVAEIINHNCISVNQDIKYAIQVKIASAEIVKMVEEMLPEYKTINKNKFSVDERRFPTGWNACLAEITRRLKGGV